MKRNKKKVLSALICALALVMCTLTGCQQMQNVNRRYKVYMITKSLATQFWVSAVSGANAARTEYNINLTLLAPDTEEEYEVQNEYIRQAIRDGADAIVFSAISYTENAEAIDEAADAGLKIVVIDSDVNSQKVHARIGTDNIQAGRMTAQAVLACEEEELSVGIVNFDLGTRNGQEREQGLREGLSEDPRVKEINTVNVPTSRDAAIAGSEILLAEHPDTNVLVGLNEPLAVGVGAAVEKMGLQGRVRAVGFDTNLNCVDMMRDGAISALIAQNPYAMGYLGVEAAWNLLEGQASYDPNILIDTATSIITPENMFTEGSQRALFSFE